MMRRKRKRRGSEEDKAEEQRRGEEHRLFFDRQRGRLSVGWDPLLKLKVRRGRSPTDGE